MSGETAAERVAVFLETREKARGLDAELIYGMSEHYLTTSDLRALIAQAAEVERLREALTSIGAAHECGEIMAAGTPGFMVLMEARAALARPAAAEAEAE